MSASKKYPITAEVTLQDNEGFIFNVIGSNGDIYIVGYEYDDGWLCPCPDHMFRKRECKHIRACKEELAKMNIHVSDKLFCEVGV